MNSFIYLAPVAGVIALIFAFYKAMTINKSEAGNSQRKRKNPQRSTRKERRCYESCHKSQRGSHEEKDALYGTRRIEANPRLPEKRHMVPSHIKRQGEAMNAGPLLPLVRQRRKQTAHALCRCRASRQVTSTSKVSPATHTPSGRGDMPPAPSPN